MVEAARHRAGLKGRPCTITPEHVRAVWPRDGRCPVLGMRLRRGRGGPTGASPTLDRLDNRKGYVPGNIAVISKKANAVKGVATAQELEQVARWMRAQGLN